MPNVDKTHRGLSQSPWRFQKIYATDFHHRVELRFFACDNWRVPLSENELRVLRQIEEELEQDPTFAQKGYRLMLESELRVLGRDRLGQLPISAWFSGNVRRPERHDVDES